MRGGSHRVSVATEKIIDRTMSRKKSLGLPRRFEASHLQQLPKEAFDGVLVSALLDKDIQHCSVLSHGTPQIVMIPPDDNEHLVEIPRIDWTPLAVTELFGKGGPEFQALLPHGFIAD